MLTEGKLREGRSAVLFCRHLDDLRRAFRQYKLIHVVCDNAGTQTPDRSKAVRAYLKAWGQRVRVHYLPKYAPDTNPIGRVWWRPYEAVTLEDRTAEEPQAQPEYSQSSAPPSARACDGEEETPPPSGGFVWRGLVPWRPANDVAVD